MKIRDFILTDAVGAYTNDDQAAIKHGAVRDGFFYIGDPVTDGYEFIRQPARAVSILVLLEDGGLAVGDAVSVQYAGQSGRQSITDMFRTDGDLVDVLRKHLAGRSWQSFREVSDALRELELPTAIEYGVSQALLLACSVDRKRLIPALIADEYSTGADIARPVPIFAQSGEDRFDAVDHMIFQEVDALPHGLINNAHSLIGRDGATLHGYVSWVRHRVLERRLSESYSPTLHFDCYGTIGETFATPDELANYLGRLAEAAKPFPLRIEQPVDRGSPDGQLLFLSELRRCLQAQGVPVQIVADEWCNTLEDVQAYIAADVVDMIHVKMPDLGSVDVTIRALIACKNGGVGAYCGGSCTETEIAGRIAAAIAMGTGADLLLARPGMGVNVAAMVVRNEMARLSMMVEASE